MVQSGDAVKQRGGRHPEVVGDVEKPLHRHVSLAGFYSPKKAPVHTHRRGRGSLTLPRSLSQLSDVGTQSFMPAARHLA